ncbi:hypothetical protein JAO06_12585 [Burkholderia multivorans]|nr:hypothetical protein [Burkholderia multivorans]
MTTDKSRADALMDAIEQLNGLLDSCENGSKDERREARSAIHSFYRRALLAASPVEQPAAAPVEEMIRFCPECGRLGDIPAGYEACCPDWSQARIVPKRFAELCAETFRLCVSQPFPKSSAAPVDERAAFESLKGAWQSMPPFDVFCAGWQAARAASANETGAEGAPRYAEWLHLRAHGEWPNGVPEWARDYTGRMNDFTAATAVIEELAALASRAPEQAAEPVAWQYRPIINGKPYPWIECTKEAAQRLRADDFRGTHEVRDLFDTPQPPAQADDREGLTFDQWWSVGGWRLVSQAGAKNGWRGAAEAGYIGGLFSAAASVAEPEPRAEVTDSARLDWIAHHGISLRQDPDTKRWFLVAPYHTKIECVDDHTRFESARAAIDAARAGGKQ